MSPNALAALFLKAAQVMDDPAHQLGCCKAISTASNNSYLYSSPQHNAFKDAFPWVMEYQELSHWRALDSYGDVLHRYPEDARQARVLALLFCAEMAKLGEIG